MGDETYAAFEQAISAREKAGERQVSEIKAMQHLVAIGSGERPGQGRSPADRVRPGELHPDRMAGPDGTDAVTEITDLWTFERDLSQQDPTWRLVAARSG